MDKNGSHDHRIEEKLKRAFKHSVVLIEAAPGYCKSEQVYKALKHAPNNYAWMRLRRMDNYLNFNWKQLMNALSTIFPNQSRRFGELEAATTFGQIAELIELIERATLNSERKVLVIDDYSIIQDKQVQFIYENLVESNFTKLCIVIIGSQKSTIQKICSRSHSDLFYIDKEVLRFTKSETRELFEGNRIYLSSEQLAGLTRKWQGWPLPLIELTKKCKNADEIMGYSYDKIHQMFYSQFFSEFTIEQQKSLIQLSILEEVPSELFGFLLGPLEEENQFLEKHPFLFYDYKKDVYSFQEAYGEFLKERYSVLSEVEKQNFYSVAAEVFLKRGELEKSLSLFFCNHQYDQVVNLIWKLITTFMNYSQAEFLYDYSQRIPKEYLDRNVYAKLQQSCLLFFMGEISKAEGIISESIKKLEAEKHSDKNALGNAYYFLSQINRMNADKSFLEHTRLASVYLYEGSYYWETSIPIMLKASWVRFPSYDENASDQLEYAKKIYKELNQYYTKIFSGVDIHADKFCEAEIAYYQHDLKTARMQLVELYYTLANEKAYEAKILFFYYMMRIELLEGNILAAENLLKSATEFINENKLHQYNGFQARLVSWLALYLHKPNDVPDMVVRNHEEKDAPLWELAINGFHQAKYLIQTQQFEEALALLNYLEKYYSPYKGLWMNSMNVFIYRSIAYLKLNKHESAINDLKKAYDMSYGNKIINPFVEWEKEMRHLIQVVRKKAPKEFDQEWCDVIYTKSTTLAKKISKFCKQRISDEGTSKLTPRRLEILRDIAQGLTAEEIAKERDITVHTVHSHVKNIYSDLGAINRADAIRIATEKKLI